MYSHSSISHRLERIEKAIADVHSLIQSQCLSVPASLPMKQPQEVAEVLAPAQGIEDEPKKRVGPAIWNEFLKDYIRNQAAKGRTITYDQAREEGRPIYYAKFGRQIPITRKKRKNLAAAAAVASEQTPPPQEQVRNTTPGRVTPVKRMNTPTPTPLQTLIATITGRSPPPTTTPAQTSTPTSTPTPTPAPTATPTPEPQPQSVAKTNNNSRPSPATYGYQDLGMAANDSARKILIDGEEYFMTNQDRALFRRRGEELDDWVGYLEPGGTIRYTESPENGTNA